MKKIYSTGMSILTTVIVVLHIIIMTGNGIVQASGDNLVPTLITDKVKYNRGELIELQFKFNNVQEDDKVNSATFELEYDSVLFELATGNLSNDVEDGCFYLADKSIVDKDQKTKIAMLFASYSDISLSEGETVFTVYLRTKYTNLFGNTKITLYTRDMLDSQNNYYNINNGQPISVELELLPPYPDMPSIINNGVRFTNADGQNIYKLTPLEKVKIIVNIKNNTTQSQNGVLAAALYNEDNKLECIGIVNCSIPFGEEKEFTNGFILPENIEDCTIKVMLWDSFVGMNPLCSGEGILAAFPRVY